MIDIHVTDNGLGYRGILVRLPAGSRDLLSFEKLISYGVSSYFPHDKAAGI
jgi:hypothetical protein